MSRLTPAQRELLVLLADGPRIDITDDRIARHLEARDLAFHFYETTAHGYNVVWIITPEGLAALAEKDQPR